MDWEIDEKPEMVRGGHDLKLAPAVGVREEVVAKGQPHGTQSQRFDLGGKRSFDVSHKGDWIALFSGRPWYDDRHDV